MGLPKCHDEVHAARRRQTGCLAILQPGRQDDARCRPATRELGRGDSRWTSRSAHAVCQNCRINLYEANTNSFANLGTAVNTAATQGADAISNSYGAFGSDCGTQSAYNHTKIAVDGLDG